MKSFKSYLIVILLMFTGVVWTSCSNSKNENSTIKIGATLDLTGPNASYGEQVKEGIDLAVDAVNDTGGVNGKKLKVLYQDSKSNPSEAVSNARRFISLNNVQVIIGEISSSATEAMIPVVESNDVFLFAPASSSPKLTNISKNFARNWPSDIAEAGSAARFARSVRHYKHAFILYVSNDYGRGLHKKFKNVFTKLGGGIVGSETYPLDEHNFRSVLLKIPSNNTDVIYLAGNPTEMGRAIKQLRERNISIPVISDTGFLQEDCLNLAGAAANGVVVPTPSYNPKQSNSKIASNFYENFKDHYKKDPSFINANGYDAIQLIVEAIKEKGYDGEEIAKYVRNKRNFEGAAGKESFKNGDVQVPITFKVIQNGEPKVLNTSIDEN